MAVWERNAVEALISFYEEKRCLYEVSSPDYHLKQKRSSALQDIATNLLPFRPGTTSEEVKTKINGLRTQYMAEKNKLIRSKKSGAGVEEVVRPKLWCYNNLSFLERHTAPRKSVSNLDPVELNKETPIETQSGELSDVTAEEQHEIGTIPVPLLSEESTSASADHCNISSRSGSSRGVPTPKRRRTGEADITTFLSKASSALEQGTLRKNTKFEKFGLFVGQEIADISDEKKQKAAMQKIFDIVMKAKDDENES
ncbi:uncharacterized protein LOC124154942 [Ischnura elegans]|uniref:uncharacterized protein LOC124154942 n=1 Tax=Ischnura elegans TaxID=197161 RepID=UPI001ED86AFA|nr:uncharacterized protein LOC124154942 [Ischnura elegans]